MSMTKADYDELVRLRGEGWEWLARDKDGWIAVSKNRPQWSRWGYDHNGEYKWIGLSEKTLPFVEPEESACIAAAIAECGRRIVEILGGVDGTINTSKPV